MFTIEVYSPTAKKYKPSGRTARSRAHAILHLSLAKGKARVKDADGTPIAQRSVDGKLSLLRSR